MHRETKRKPLFFGSPNKGHTHLVSPKGRDNLWVSEFDAGSRCCVIRGIGRGHLPSNLCKLCHWLKSPAAKTGNEKISFKTHREKSKKFLCMAHKTMQGRTPKKKNAKGGCLPPRQRRPSFSLQKKHRKKALSLNWGTHGHRFRRFGPPPKRFGPRATCPRLPPSPGSRARGRGRPEGRVGRGAWETCHLDPQRTHPFFLPTKEKGAVSQVFWGSR